MKKGPGSGWHKESERHSRARKYGKAGGSYKERTNYANKYNNGAKESRNKKVGENIINAALNNQDEITKLWLTLNYGHKIYIYEDGQIGTLQTGSRPITDKEYVTINAPGAGNIDESWFLEGWAHQREDGAYIENETGRNIGDWDDVVAETLDHGDVSDTWEGIKDRIEQEIAEQYPK